MKRSIARRSIARRIRPASRSSLACRFAHCHSGLARCCRCTAPGAGSSCEPTAANKKPRHSLEPGVSVYGLAATYFRVRNAHYHRRKPVSRFCSGWEGVGPGCYKLIVRFALRLEPLYEAEIVTVVEMTTMLVFTVKVALVAPAGTVTLEGTVAALVLLLESVT